MKKYIATVYAPDDYEPKYFGRGSVDFFFTNKAGDSEIISTEMIEVDDGFEIPSPKEG